MPFHEQRDRENADPTGKTTLVFLERFGVPKGGGEGSPMFKRILPNPDGDDPLCMCGGDG